MFKKRISLEKHILVGPYTLAKKLNLRVQQVTHTHMYVFNFLIAERGYKKWGLPFSMDNFHRSRSPQLPSYLVWSFIVTNSSK